MPPESEGRISMESPIGVLGLSSRAANALYRAHLTSLGELCQAKASGTLPRVRGIGAACMQEILTRLEQLDVGSGSGAHRDPSLDYALLAAQAKLRIVDEVNHRCLHEKVQVAQHSVRELLDLPDDRYTEVELQLLNSILSGARSCSQEIEELLGLPARTSQARVFVQRYGPTKRTLQSIGDELGVTRERVRQIASREARIVRSAVLPRVTVVPSLGLLPIRIQTALLIAFDRGMQLSLRAWESEIRDSGLLGAWTTIGAEDIDLFDALVAIVWYLSSGDNPMIVLSEPLILALNAARGGSRDVPVETMLAGTAISRKTRAAIRRHNAFSGAVNVRWLSTELNVDTVSLCRDVMALGFIVLSSDWYWREDPVGSITRKNVFHRAVCKMLQFCGPLTVEEICGGLRCAVRRQRYPVAPPSLMERLLVANGYRLEDGLVSYEGELAMLLSKGERAILDCIQGRGRVVNHNELCRAFLDAGLSLPLLYSTLRCSPLFERVGHGCVKLRGMPVHQHDLDRARRTLARQTSRADVSYDRSGRISITVVVSDLCLAAGTMTASGLPSFAAAGDWPCIVKGSYCGSLRVSRSSFRHLSQAYAQLEVHPGDKVTFHFDVPQHMVTLETSNDR